jgi:lipid II:glycine glycyltransferase (peptidoglycan interpeptide bridge formation enzyme)
MLHTQKTYQEWDTKVAQATGWCHFWQSAEWASTQSDANWQADLTEVILGKAIYPLAIYSRRVRGLGSAYQVPKLASLSPNKVKAFTDDVKSKTGQGLVVKLEIDQIWDETTHQALLRAGWLRVPSVQYRETVLIDLTKGSDEILKSFKKRARWELNAGLRRGVKVEKVGVTPENMNLFYNLLSQTYQRGRFVTRNRHFTERYWQEFAKSGHGSLYIARLDDQPLAAAYIIQIGERAFYKDGASIRLKPDVFASRVLQWQVIQELKGQGIKLYDLCGVSTHSGSDLAGVTLFKTGFGESVELQGGYELPLSNWRYKLWKRLVERLATRYSQAVRRELWY